MKKFKCSMKFVHVINLYSSHWTHTHMPQLLETMIIIILHYKNMH